MSKNVAEVIALVLLYGGIGGSLWSLLGIIANSCTSVTEFNIGKWLKNVAYGGGLALVTTLVGLTPGAGSQIVAGYIGATALDGVVDAVKGYREKAKKSETPKS